MTQYVCDRCKKIFNKPHPNFQVQFPSVKLFIYRDTTMFFNGGDVDLCRDCEKELYDFIYRKERFKKIYISSDPLTETPKRCAAYREEYGKKVCYGTKEKEQCTCNGNKSKCDFY